MENNSASISGSEKYEFILFVSGMSVKSTQAIENLNEICDKHLNNNFDIQIIDIHSNPEMATEFQIIAIPTLIKIKPDPRRILLGDLSDTEKALKILDINQ